MEKTYLKYRMIVPRMGVLVCLIGLLTLASSCSTTQVLREDNYSDVYNQDEILIRNDYKVYHPKPEQTVVYVRIAANDLMFVENQEKLSLEAAALINVKVFPNDPIRSRAVDSVTVRIDEVSPGGENTFLHTAVNLALPEGYRFRAILRITDVNSGEIQTSRFEIDKESAHTRQNFLVFQTEKRLPVYEPYITRPGRLRIKNNQGKDMTVRYYRRYFPLPPPPFSSYTPPPFKYDADSIFTISATPDFSILEATQTGFYHILTDDTQKDGFTLFTFPDPFPVVGTTRQMFESVRYLTTEWEYREMKQKGNTRAAIEDFWLDCAGSKTKAKELIDLYYSRVEEANQFFTSYVEGWKTDRGLIHIVYGKPNIIYKGNNSETWIYGEDKNVMSLSFTFVKVINPFTDNDFRLERDENFKASWYRAIESWRNGRVYAN